MSVFFHLEKSFDNVWRYGTIRNLKCFGMPIIVLSTISSYMAETGCCDRVVTALSRVLVQENVPPHGEVLS